MEMDWETKRMLEDIEFEVAREQHEQLKTDLTFIKMVIENMTQEQKRNFALRLKEELENDSD